MDKFSIKSDKKNSSESQVADSAYQGHNIHQQIDKYAEFYDKWSFLVFSFTTLGTHAIANIDSYLFSSVKGTLCSIRLVLKDGHINDAWALLRKYHDSIIINVYSNLYLADNFSVNNFIVEKIDDWCGGKSSLPEYRAMSQYIRNHKNILELNELLYGTDERYKKIRERCNDHTHYNFFKNMLINDNEIRLTSRISHLDRMLRDLNDLFILHISHIFCIKEHYMASSDYIDHLECGDTPPENSQYWVAPFIQEIFNDTLERLRPDIAAHIKNRVNMHLE